MGRGGKDPTEILLQTLRSSGKTQGPFGRHLVVFIIENCAVMG